METAPSGGVRTEKEHVTILSKSKQEGEGVDKAWLCRCFVVMVSKSGS